MCSLGTFPSPPPQGFVTVCETNGELVATRLEDVQAGRYPQSVNYPQVDISKELSKQALSRETARSAFLEHDGALRKRVYDAWFERGLNGVLEEIAHEKSRKRESQCPTWLSSVAGSFLALLRWSHALHSSIVPHLSMSSEDMIAEFSQNGDWKNSIARCFAWHPHTTKFAIALIDDSIRVYMADRAEIVPNLKHKLQHGVADLAWKPYSASVLAVGCQNGVLIWNIEPTSLATRPSTSAVQVLTSPGHLPVTSVAWDPQGGVLVSASPADSSMMVWDIGKEECQPLRRVSGGTSFVVWAPEGHKLMSATPAANLRVWETKTWNFEKWSNLSGCCKAACWSPDGTILLFATAEEPMIYSLTFSNSPDGPGSVIGGSKVAVTSIDVSSVELESQDGSIVVGGSVQAMKWDPKGERLAIQFNGGSSELIALFQTKLHPTLEIIPCGFIRGEPGAVPNLMCFQPKYEQGALLTVVWSSGRLSFIPLQFVSRRSLEQRSVPPQPRNVMNTSVFYSPR